LDNFESPFDLMDSFGFKLVCQQEIKTFIDFFSADDPSSA